MRKCILLAVAVLGASLLWGSSAKAQVIFVQAQQPQGVILNQGFSAVPNATFQSFGAFSTVVPTNGVFFNQGVGFGSNVIVAGRGLGARNVAVANRGVIGAGRQTIIQRNGLFGSRTTIINR